jgi:hypothetical protein
MERDQAVNARISSQSMRQRSGSMPTFRTNHRTKQWNMSRAQDGEDFEQDCQIFLLKNTSHHICEKAEFS